MVWPRRVPYEWILGAMFVGTFVVDQTCRLKSSGFWMGRGIWLVVVLPIALADLGVKRDPDVRRPLLGIQLVAAVLGWLFIGAVLLVVAYKRELGEATFAFLETVPWVWAALLVFNLACLLLVGRGFGVLANATTLLLFAWGFDMVRAPAS